MPSELDDRRIPLVVVGDPQSRRMPLLRAAASRSGFEMSVLSYDELLNGVRPEWFDRDNSRGNGGAIAVRIESPGESRETARRILTAGIEPMEQRRRVPLGQSAIDAAELDRGEIVHPLQWFLGFERVLRQLDGEWGPQGVRWMNSPASIALAFDKSACRELWSQTGVPIASAPVSGPVTTYSQLRAAVPDRHARLFVKLRYGYSAMGAVALEWRGDLVRAITTVDVTWNAGRPRLFLSKRPRVLHREFEIAWLIDTLAMEEIVVEDWLSKARWQGKPFDVRIVIVGGRARQVVGRASSSPFTNLNLDGDRISEEDIVQHLGAEWPELRTLAERAAAQLSGAWSLGMDVLVRPCRRRGVVLEANAFGDYLPGLLCEGETTYETELRTWKSSGSGEAQS